MMRAAVIALAAAAFAVSGASARTVGPNVRGVLDRGSATSPACYPDEPCDPAPVGVFVVFSRDGHRPVRTRVRSNGSFAVRLAPARYRISLAPPPLSGQVTPTRVRAPRQGVARLKLEIRN
jgi:hypothetical protein